MIASVREKIAVAAIVCVMVMALPLRLAFADGTEVGTTFSVDGITYAITADGQVSVGSGKVGQQAVSREWEGLLAIPATVQYESKTYEVTSVAAYACAGCTKLEEVSLPASVTMLGFNSFGYCGTMDDTGDQPMYSGLSKFTIEPGSQLRLIGENAFIKDYALQAFEIPASVENISQRAFQDCFSFEYFQCEEGSQLKGIAKRAFAASLPEMDPSTINSHAMGPGAWPTRQGDGEGSVEKQYANLKIVHLPASLTTLGDGAFENQRALTELEWDDGCQMNIIGEYSFQYCASLTEASVPAVLHAPEGLGPYSFQYCVNLRTFTYKGFIRAPYSGYSERGLFRGVKSLETVIYLTDKYHLPHGTLTTVDTARNTFSDCDPTVYYQVMFYASQQDAEEGGSPIGSAIIREGTHFSKISATSPVSDEQGTIVYSGAVPELEDGFGWASKLGGGPTLLTNAVSAYPVEANDLAGAGVELSELDFSYSGEPCLPEVVVKDVNEATVDPSCYTLVWERQGEDESWAVTDDYVSPGNLRVWAQAAASGQYVGATQPAMFSITLLSQGSELTIDGMMYTVINDALSDRPTVMLGDSYGDYRAVDPSASGVVTVPEVVYPQGSSLGYTVTQIAPNAFGAAEASEACSGITEVVLPNSIEVIGGGAFRNMASLKTVVLPAALTTLKANAFANDENLESVVFEGDEIEMIGVRAFANCGSLASIVLPTITGSLGAAAFENCVGLQEVVFTGNVAASATNQFKGSDFIERMVFYGNNPGFDLGDFVTCYARVTFLDSEQLLLGSADIRVGTELAKINSSLSEASILGGAIPAYPEGMGRWEFSDHNADAGAVLIQAALAVAAPAQSGSEDDPSGTDPDNPGGNDDSSEGTNDGGDGGSGNDDPASEPEVEPVQQINDGDVFVAGSKASKASYKVKSVEKRTVAYKLCKSTNKKAATVPATVKIKGQSYTVVSVLARAFKAKKSVKTVTVKSKNITSFAKAFAQSKVKTVKVPKAKKKAYKKLLKKRLCGRAVTVV